MEINTINHWTTMDEIFINQSSFQNSIVFPSDFNMKNQKNSKRRGKIRSKDEFLIELKSLINKNSNLKNNVLLLNEFNRISEVIKCEKCRSKTKKSDSSWEWRI